MCLSDISLENQKKEKDIQDNIFNLIDNNKSFIFSSGAGAGKTYALTETLKYTINKYGDILRSHNQKIVCITYTNVAVEEVKRRLGSSSLVLVSTIHERIWEFIKKYDKQLVEIHKEKLIREIKKIENKLNISENFKKLEEDLKDEFVKIMLKERDAFYSNYDKSSKEFREKLEGKLKKFGEYNLLNNVKNFKSYVNKIYKIENFKSCVKDIENQQNKKLNYTSIYNEDRLHKMVISHDTLLEYGFEIISRYDLLARIIIDSYPYILIDEYQDTNEKVIRIMKRLHVYAVKFNRPFVVSYFGDTYQNIYEDGVGKDIFTIHNENIEIIKKEFNRRSYKEIVEISNNIKMKENFEIEVKQESVFSDCTGGSVEFMYLNNIESKTEDEKEEIINNIIDDTKKKFNIDIENKLDCLILTNKLLTKYVGFETIYNLFSRTKYYKKNYNQISTEILSNDLKKLGVIPLLLYKIINFKKKLLNPKTLLKDILNNRKDNILNVKKTIETLVGLSKKNEIETLEDFLKELFSIYETTQQCLLKFIIKDLLNDDNNIVKNLEDFTLVILSNLYKNIEPKQLEEAKKTIDNLLKIPLKEYDSWYDFITGNMSKEVIYHTYHSTKGLEFKNILIIIGNDFGLKNKDFFSDFFLNYNKKLDKNEQDKYEKAQNLLYVACSRAIKNLRILYLNDISLFKGKIEEIFGEDNIKKI